MKVNAVGHKINFEWGSQFFFFFLSGEKNSQICRLTCYNMSMFKTSVASNGMVDALKFLQSVMQVRVHPRQWGRGHEMETPSNKGFRFLSP